MLVLIATNELQGAAPWDYAHTVEGELVTASVVECSEPADCGCGRGFPGLASACATTTAMVVERPHLTERDLRDALRDWLERDGWLELLSDALAPGGDEVDRGVVTAEQLLDEIVDEHVEAITFVCSNFPVGTVVSRRGSAVVARHLPTAA